MASENFLILSNPTSTPFDSGKTAESWKKPGVQKQTLSFTNGNLYIYANASKSSYSYCCHIMVYKYTHICLMYTSNHIPSILQYWSLPIILLWSNEGVSLFFQEPSIGQPVWLAPLAPVTISLRFICVTRQPKHPVMPKPGNESSGIHSEKTHSHAPLISSVYCYLFLSLTNIYSCIRCHTWLF